jgi:hypothetical protein
MARNTQTFQIENRVGLKLTPELSELFINTVKQTGRISIAAGRCCVGQSTVRDWLRKGRLEKAEPIFKEFADAVEKARSEFLALAAKRLAQLAIGGTLDLPAYDKQNRLIRDANDEIIFEPRYFPPNPNALMHILDRIDPMPNLEPQQPGIPMAPELTDAEQLAEAAKHYDFFSEVVRTMVELGHPVERLLGQSAQPIETTAAPAPAEAEPVKEDVAASDVLKPETPAEPGRPKFDAF